MKLLKNFLILLGLGCIVWLIVDTGPQKIWHEISSLGVYSLLFLVPYIIVYIFDTLGWQYSFCSDIRTKFSTLFSIRLAGEAINHITPTAYLGGEPLKAYMLYQRENIPLAHGLASVTIGKFMMTATEVIFILAGIGVAVIALGKQGPLVSGIVLSLLVLIAFLVAFLVMQINGFGSSFSSWIRKTGIFRGFFEKHKEAIEKFDGVLIDYYRTQHKQLFWSFTYYMISWLVGVFEIFIFLKLTGHPADLTTVFAMEAIAVAIKGAGFFIPGSLGFQEAGQVGLFVFFGFDQSTGVTFSILRRFRELIWIIGGLCLLYGNWERKMVEDAFREN